ncbi:unnamed protein product [Larinioides sclopetarius]|uniref:Uncharacterized protein n=1 Tax=Larinioides sclopetarius TaxID=280406 RepID=A0AAV1ZFX6_9ARAC
MRRFLDRLFFLPLVQLRYIVWIEDFLPFDPASTVLYFPKCLWNL